MGTCLFRAKQSLPKISLLLSSGLLQKESYNRLAENLFLSDTAFKYRLYKLFSAANCKNRTELTELFRNYIPEFDKNLP